MSGAAARIPDVGAIDRGSAAGVGRSSESGVRAMSDGLPRGGRLPRDVRARERLREAQLQETEAVAAICAAEEALRKACAKRDAAVAAASATVDRARASVESAQVALVRVSGLDRAAVLLGVDTATLRKVVGAGTGRVVQP